MDKRWNMGLSRILLTQRSRLLLLDTPPQCPTLDTNSLQVPSAPNFADMSFHAGLAASPDLSNDVEINHNEERAAHEQLLHEAYSQVQSLNEARHYTDTEDESQQIYGSFDFSRKDLESLPAELVDVIGQHADRLALGWNKLTGLSTLGPRLAEFTNLRYLVMRNNLLEDFPQPVSIPLPQATFGQD